ncbi:MAG: GHKL domain-containing protein [Clostridiales bacterium]|nr:GHKL domain-containing protein [Clostridiales bacterium]
MKQKTKINKRKAWVGVVSFFLLVAIIMQIAILTYDFIIEKTDNVALIAVLILVLIAILSTVITLIDYIRRKVMIERPVRKILSATGRIAKGDFSVRLVPNHPYDKYDEFDVIMEDINILAQELGKNEVLKTDFVSNVSHELKTPLAIIQNYAKMLQNENLDSETRQKYANTLVTASKRLSDLVSNVLILNKLENQGIKPQSEKTNVTELLAQTVLQYEEVLENKNIDLVCDFDDVVMQTIPSYLEIVFANLVSNATKFTPENGEINVKLKQENEKIIFSVKDTGCGISSEVGSRIFEKFFQADSSHSQQGNGLGLALVKKVVDNLGGEISVSSQLGKGTTFVVTFFN